jgi:hypothetical protein
MNPPISLIGKEGPNPTRGCVDRVRSPCSTPIQDKISAAPTRCSPNTRLDKKARECASGEQRGGAAEILSWIGVEHGERTQSTHPRAVRGKRGQSERVTVINMQFNAYLSM